MYERKSRRIKIDLILNATTFKCSHRDDMPKDFRDIKTETLL